jgi:hypothetical protein
VVYNIPALHNVTPCSLIDKINVPSAFKMVRVGSESSKHIHQTARRHLPEGSNNSYFFSGTSAGVSEEHVSFIFTAEVELHTGFLLALFFDPDAGGDSFFRNVG